MRLDETEPQNLHTDVYRQAIRGGEVTVRVLHVPTGLRAEATGHGFEMRIRRAAMEELTRLVSEKASTPGL